MPAVADRIVAPVPETPRRRPLLAALAVGASLAVHGVALAAAIGFWGSEDTVPPQPFEVVMVAVTRPSLGPAPSSDGAGAPAPERAERSGPPAVAMPVAETAAPAVRAPLPVRAQSPAAPIRPVAPPKPKQVSPVTTDTPLPAAVAETAIQVARVERREEPRSAEATPVLADPPRPVARPTEPRIASQAAGQTPAGEQMAVLPPARQETGASRATTGQAPAEPSGGGSRPAEFSLGSAGNPAPDYPFRARQRGWEGRVVLRVEVDRDGRPVRIMVAESSGHGVLDQAAHRTIATWVFRPATSGGRSVASETLVPIVFRLN